MKGIKAIAALLILFVCMPSFAAQGWISDKVHVPVRAGEGTSYKILHRGLPSGTAIEVLSKGDSWTKIKYGEIEGYISSQYVTSTPTAAIQLAQSENKLSSTSTELSKLKEKFAETDNAYNTLQKQYESLSSELKESSESLAYLNNVAAEPIRLDQANQKLNQEVSELRTQLDALEAENHLLRSDNTNSQRILGVAILLLGVVIGVVVKGKGKNNRGGWA